MNWEFFSPIQKEPLWYLDFSENGKSIKRYSIVHMHEEIKLSYHHVEYDFILSKGLRLESSDLRSESSPDVILVPGLGFTERAERIGRGKGYFDSYIKDFKGITIGLCFEEQIMSDVYAEAHDEKLNYIVTDKRIIKGI